MKKSKKSLKLDPFYRWVMVCGKWRYNSENFKFRVVKLSCDHLALQPVRFEHALGGECKVCGDEVEWDSVAWTETEDWNRWELPAKRKRRKNVRNNSKDD